MIPMDPLEEVARIGVFLVSLLLFFPVVIAYARVRTSRMGWIALALGLFLVMGTVLLLGALSEGINRAISEGVAYSLDLLALVMLAVGLLWCHEPAHVS